MMNFEDTSMETMMKELENMMDSGDFDDAFGGILGELVTKDLLHEPMKELMAKYPDWLKEHKDKISSLEHSRYTSQYEVVQRIVQVFDGTSATDLTEEETKTVMDLMQKMQDFGNPPDGLMDDLGPNSANAPTEMPPECKQM